MSTDCSSILHPPASIRPVDVGNIPNEELHAQASAQHPHATKAPAAAAPCQHNVSSSARPPSSSESGSPTELRLQVERPTAADMLRSRAAAEDANRPGQLSAPSSSTDTSNGSGGSSDRNQRRQHINVADLHVRSYSSTFTLDDNSSSPRPGGAAAAYANEEDTTDDRAADEERVARSPATVVVVVADPGVVRHRLEWRNKARAAGSGRMSVVEAAYEEEVTATGTAIDETGWIVGNLSATSSTGIAVFLFATIIALGSAVLFALAAAGAITAGGSLGWYLAPCLATTLAWALTLFRLLWIDHHKFLTPRQKCVASADRDFEFDHAVLDATRDDVHVAQTELDTYEADLTLAIKAHMILSFVPAAAVVALVGPRASSALAISDVDWVPSAAFGCLAFVALEHVAVALSIARSRQKAGYYTAVAIQHLGLDFGFAPL